MEKLYKKISHFIKILIYSLISTLKVLVLSDKNNKLPTTQEKKVIVIANGPSLKKIYAEDNRYFLQNECIITNTFPVSELFLEIKPKYLVWIDPYMWTGDTAVIKNTYKVLKNKVEWNLILFVPTFCRKFSNKIVSISKHNPNIEIRYYNYFYYKGFSNLGHWLYKHNLAFPRAWNVTIAATFLAINMGFKKIYIVGADHTWHENLHMDQNNILHTKVEHFFENSSEVEFVPFYRNGNIENGTNSAKDFFLIWSKTFEGHEEVKSYADYRKVEIYNSSEESFIDAFPRKKLNTINQ